MPARRPSPIDAILEEELAAAVSAAVPRIRTRLAALFGVSPATPTPTRRARPTTRSPAAATTQGPKFRRLTPDGARELQRRARAVFRGDERIKLGDVMGRLRTTDRKRVARALAPLVEAGALTTTGKGFGMTYGLAKR
jgi:hypothetical protein